MIDMSSARLGCFVRLGCFPGHKKARFYHVAEALSPTTLASQVARSVIMWIFQVSLPSAFLMLPVSGNHMRMMCHG